MRVESYRHSFSAEYFAAAKLGELFEVDSGLGGSFTVELKSRDKDGVMLFAVTNPEWPYKYKYTNEQAAEHVFIIMPNKSERILYKHHDSNSVAAALKFRPITTGHACKLCRRPISTPGVWRAVGFHYAICEICWT